MSRYIRDEVHPPNSDIVGIQKPRPGRGRPKDKNESPGLLPHGHFDEESYENFLEMDLASRRKLTGRISAARPMNMTKLIRRFGGPTILHQRLLARGFKLTLKAIEKWRERNRINTDWLSELYIMSAEEGRPLILEEYIVGFPSETRELLKLKYEASARAQMKARGELLAQADEAGKESLLD